jgi:hypothetical protein
MTIDLRLDLASELTDFLGARSTPSCPWAAASKQAIGRLQHSRELAVTADRRNGSPP